MNKPLILSVKDTEEKIIKIINSSNIPAFIMKNSIEKILKQLVLIEQQEYESAKSDYEREASKNESDK